MKIGIQGLDPWYFIDSGVNLKTKLLYFDKLHCRYGPIQVIEKLSSITPDGTNEFHKKIDEIELLQTAGLVKIVNRNEVSSLLKSEEFDLTLLENTIKLQELAIEQYEGVNDIIKEMKSKKVSLIDGLATFLTNCRVAEQITARHNSLIFNSIDKENEYSPIITFEDDIDHRLASRKYQVINLVLKEFPTLDMNVSLDFIQDFKEDSDITNRLFSLRDFINNISNSNLSRKEIADKIEYLISQYSEGLEKTKMKYSYNKLELIAITTAEIVENLATLKFSKALKTVFDIKKTDIQLYEAEEKLIGKEVSFIHKSHEFAKNLSKK